MAQRGGRRMGMEKIWNVTTLYFSNFPNSYGARDLSNIFRRWGEIVDVFIARRLNKSRGRYGFVKFANVRNVRRLISELNTIQIGSVKLYVPWFNREMSKESQGNRSHAANRTSAYTYERKHSMMDPKPIQRNQGKKVNVKNGEKHVKIEQVWKVKKVNAMQYKRMFTTEIKGVDWMEECMVGWSHPELGPEEVSRTLAKMGLGCVRSRHMGDNLFLLSITDGYYLKDLIEGNSEGLAEIFHTITKWEPNSYAGNKNVWIQVRGLPHIFWNEECFKFIVAKHGTLSEIDRSTMFWERLDYARLKVRTPNSSNISGVENIVINGVECTVCLREEVDENNLDLVSRWSSDSVSSFSIWPDEFDPNLFIEDKEEEDMYDLNVSYYYSIKIDC